MTESGDKIPAAEPAESAREAFARLYEQHMPGVYRYINYRVGNIQLAEDLTAAVFEKALGGFKRYQSDMAAFSTWVMSIARNTVIDHFRVQSKRRSLPLETAGNVAADNPSPEHAAMKTEELKRLRFCLEGLSRQEQEIVSLKFGGEMNNRRAAVVLGLSESNIGTIIYRAVRKLRDCFRTWQSEQGR